VKKYFVGNLPFTLSEDSLRMHFENITPLFVKLLLSEGKPKGCAYIGIRDEDEAKFIMQSKEWVFHNRIPRIELFNEVRANVQKVSQ
jgi:RNA recognition motif-containing protein